MYKSAFAIACILALGACTSGQTAYSGGAGTTEMRDVGTVSPADPRYCPPDDSACHEIYNGMGGTDD